VKIVVNFISCIPRFARRSVLISVDALLILVGLWVSFSLALDDLYWPRGGVNNPIVLLALIAPMVGVPVFYQFGLYRAIIRYLGLKAVWSIVQAVTVYGILWGFIVFLSGVQEVPRSVLAINTMVTVLSIGGSRMLVR